MILQADQLFVRTSNCDPHPVVCWASFLHVGRRLNGLSATPCLENAIVALVRILHFPVILFRDGAGYFLLGREKQG
jgi:hypothetical protein